MHGTAGTSRTSHHPWQLADLAMLSANSLMVSDDAFRTIKSVLTMQGDRIVHLA